ENVSYLINVPTVLNVPKKNIKQTAAQSSLSWKCNIQMNNFKQAGRYFQKYLPAYIKKRVLRAIMALKDEQIKIAKNRTETTYPMHLNKIQAIWIYDICDFAQLASQDCTSFRTDFYMMYLYESGQGMYSIELEDISITARNLVFVPPNTVNQF